MNPGELNKKIEIMKLDQISDGGGGYENTLVPVAKVWASFLPVSGREYWQAQQAQSSITHKVTIRNKLDVDHSYVVRYKKKDYDIQYVMSIADENYLVMQVLERQ